MLQALPALRVAGCIVARPPAISATPLDVDQLAVARDVRRHDPLVPAGLDEVHDPREDEERAEEPPHAAGTYGSSDGLGLGDGEALLVEGASDDHARRGSRARDRPGRAGRRASRCRPSRSARPRSPRPPRAASRGRGPPSARRPRPACRRSGSIPRSASAAITSVVPRSEASVQPSAATLPERESTEATTRSPCAAAIAAAMSGSRTAAVPSTTRSAPEEIASSTFFESRRPPPSCTGTLTAATIRRTCSRLTGSPARAPSRSTTCSQRAPPSTQRRAATTGSSSYWRLLLVVALDRAGRPCRPRMSIAG